MKVCSSEITGTCFSIWREARKGDAKLEVRRVCALLKRSTTSSSQLFNKQDFLSCVVSGCSVHLLLSCCDHLCEVFRNFALRILHLVVSPLSSSLRSPASLLTSGMFCCDTAKMRCFCLSVLTLCVVFADTVFEVEITCRWIGERFFAVAVRPTIGNLRQEMSNRFC